VEPEPMVDTDGVDSVISPAAVGATLIGAGAVAGAAATLAVTRGWWRPRRLR
jgi:hypothetical protein